VDTQWEKKPVREEGKTQHYTIINYNVTILGIPEAENKKCNMEARHGTIHISQKGTGITEHALYV
jgi:hypothetical protein